MKFRWFAIQLVILCVVIFVFQNLYPQITDQFALVSAEIFYRPWIIITSIFLHGSFSHLFYNMFALALFGSILEKIIGGKNFLILFFISGIIAGIGSILFYTAAIGASGAIYGVLGALGILRPRMTVYMGYIPMPMAAAVVLWAAGDFIGLFAPGQIAYAAHLFGLGFGLLFGFLLRKKFGETLFKKKKEEISDKEFRTWEDNWMK